MCTQGVLGFDVREACFASRTLCASPQWAQADGMQSPQWAQDDGMRRLTPSPHVRSKPEHLPAKPIQGQRRSIELSTPVAEVIEQTISARQEETCSVCLLAQMRDTLHDIGLL
eukprot:CAMPEP_0195054738 /NCGR_PEP_ID=MMETSP0448-20130528/3581_1 /TAXON_ID=66468 /ORGANISM="Heterocapsa triquestra, Strain CCMP 448" /LENGTH=112 /DNA_ID=CAMNT_0040084279 /DNA_START=493 /DNA_END=829 /DNA_ORIENTATION=-